jgi:hypothetical protein
MIIAKPVIIRVTQPTRKESVSVLDLEVGVVMRGICMAWWHGPGRFGWFLLPEEGSAWDGSFPSSSETFSLVKWCVVGLRQVLLARHLR